MAKFNNKTALLSMLDWGLGHTTRCIPIIQQLQNNHIQVFVACNATQQKIIEQTCSQILFFNLKGYQVRYSKYKWQLPLYIIAQLPKIGWRIFAEHIWLKNWLQNHTVNFIISDNRYGFYNKKVTSIFITHQLTIQTPYKWLTTVLQQINYCFINRFGYSWVPDIEQQGGLAGILSHPTKKPQIPMYYIGWLSRLNTQPNTTNCSVKFCVLLSGPEPQRSILENKLYAICQQLHQPIIFIRGTENAITNLPPTPLIQVIALANATQLQMAIDASEYIICRGGYTSLMELLPLQKKLIVIPTPGQTEQEFLGNYLQQKQWAACLQQQQLSVKAIEVIIANSNFIQMPLANNNSTLQKAIDECLEN
jgi:uncharacterized protein (TIGR00661 family)